MLSKDRIKHDWNYCLQRYALGDADERDNVLRTAKAIYDRAVCEYGYSWAEKNLPKPTKKEKGSTCVDYER